MRILDLSAGKRNIWFNRFPEGVVFVDRRESVCPTVVADTRHLPFPGGYFEFLVFDPPHVTHGEHSKMAEYYTAMSAEAIKELIRLTSQEAYRVSIPNGWMAFKWNDHDVQLRHILPLMEGWEPCFGHKVAQRTKHASSTEWVLLQKRGGGFQSESQVLKILQNE